MHISLIAKAQDIPDSIVVLKNTYVWNMGNEDDIDSLYYQENRNITDKKQINKLMAELSKVDNENNLLPTFGIDTTYIKNNAEKLYCGCNYRFSKDFIEKAIFFELNNKETKASSVWFLLPDNNVLLYIMEGEKVLDYDYYDFGEDKRFHPCIIFNKNGQIIDTKSQLEQYVQPNF
ncbi:MAG: hypothetical protein LBT56_08155 [Prevotellaceae bacterium]|nr:hypothetical protein [Prevotellaceae bacterium]